MEEPSVISFVLFSIFVARKKGVKMAAAFPDDNPPQGTLEGETTSAENMEVSEPQSHDVEEASPEYIQAQNQLMLECQQLKDQISTVSAKPN